LAVAKICHSERSEEPVFAFVFAVAFALLSVIPEGNLLLRRLTAEGCSHL
jgi:hypothetical protein